MIRRGLWKTDNTIAIPSYGDTGIYSGGMGLREEIENAVNTETIPKA